jgi:hypothetical protein
MTDAWRAYYPEDGETADDARVIEPRKWGPRIYDAEYAAQRACVFDFDERDGWERSQDVGFPIVVIAPDGTETRWIGRHEPSILHIVEEAEDEE